MNELTVKEEERLTRLPGATEWNPSRPEVKQLHCLSSSREARSLLLTPSPYRSRCCAALTPYSVLPEPEQGRLNSFSYLFRNSKVAALRS